MKLKKTIITVIAVLAVFSMAMTGCGKKDVDEQTPPTDQQDGQTTPDTQKPEDEEKDAVAELAEILGKSDDEVKDLFGGGTENKTEDGTVLLGRSYETELNGKAVTLETVYDDNNTVSGISITFKDASIDEAKTMFTKSFGEPETIDETAEMDSKYFKWTKDNAEIVLNESYGMTSAQMNLIG